MPIPVIAGAALGAGQWIVQNVKNDSNAARQYRYNQMLQQQQMDYNARENALAYSRQHAENELAFNREKEWALNEREYNSPLAQLSRLRAAGINPAVGAANIQNTTSQPLDMSAASPSGASVGGSSVSMTPSAQFPDIMSIVQGLKGLELVNAQVNETNSRKNYYDTLAANVGKDIERKTAESPFWWSNANYDNQGKYYAAKDLYRTIMEKTWKYYNLFPKELQKISSEIEGLELNNRFSKESFKDRLNEIIRRNVLMESQSGYYGDLKRDINSQISARDISATQNELTGSSLRSLYHSQEAINKQREMLQKLQESAQRDLANGNYLEALKKMAMVNFMAQTLSGTLFKNLPGMPDIQGSSDAFKAAGQASFFLPFVP